MLRLILIVLFTFTLSVCSSNGKIKVGNEIITQIESFKNRSGRLPENLSEIGIKEDESGPIFYQKKSETKYILWFGKELGESVIYDSESKQWK